tara:strand:+ start:1059 stop:2210 length:1152 start_codon:yes stop_codon:yes gene_type:complete
MDGNYFVYSRLFVLPRDKKTRFLDTEKDRGMFIRKLAMDFASEMRKFKNIANRVVFVADSKSWRKDMIPEAEYKANRKQSETINWTAVFEIYDEFKELLKKRNVIVQQMSGAEGDDLVFAWSTFLNMQGDNCIIWSGDRDLMQLVNYNPANDAYSLCYDSTRKIMGVYPGFTKWLSSRTNKAQDDIFNISAVYVDDMIKQEIEGFIKTSKVKLWPIYCDEFIFTKILTGDKSDNISSVVQVVKQTKTGKTRTTRVSDNKAAQILKEFKSIHRRMSAVYLFDDDYKQDICTIIKKVMKIDTPIVDLKLKLEQNIKLMLLHTATIPDAIQTIMFAAVKEDAKIAIGQYEGLLDKDDILENTTHIAKNYIPKSMDPFANDETNTLF